MSDDAQDVTIPQLRSIHARQLKERAPDLFGKRIRAFRAFEYRFIEWEAVQPRWSKTRGQKIVTEMYRHFITEDKQEAKRLADMDDAAVWREVRSLRASTGYKTYRKMLDDSILQAARHRLENSALKYVNAHEQGLAMAIESKDHGAIPRYTESMLDRIWPKRDERPPVQVVNVVLTEKQQIADADYVEVSAERIE